VVLEPLALAVELGARQTARYEHTKVKTAENEPANEAFVLHGLLDLELLVTKLLDVSSR
jgi:hypothetical protein